jgi:hypothetical protein
MTGKPATWELCQALPKVELHAHLNGSCRDSTLKELAQGNQEITNESAHLLSKKGCTPEIALRSGLGTTW